MHVGVLPAVGIEGAPVRGELLGAGPVPLFPETFANDAGYVREQAVGVGIAGDLGARCSEQYERVAIGLLGGVGWPLVADSPIIAAVFPVAVPVPQEGQAVV